MVYRTLRQAIVDRTLLAMDGGTTYSGEESFLIPEAVGLYSYSTAVEFLTDDRSVRRGVLDVMWSVRWVRACHR